MYVSNRIWFDNKRRCVFALLNRNVKVRKNDVYTAFVHNRMRIGKSLNIWSVKCHHHQQRDFNFIRYKTTMFCLFVMCMCVDESVFIYATGQFLYTKSVVCLYVYNSTALAGQVRNFPFFMVKKINSHFQLKSTI